MHYHGNVILFALQIAVGDGSLIVAVIIYTHKTAVTGDLTLQAWPILMALANISRKRRGQPSGHVFMGRMPDVITNRCTSGYIGDNVSKQRVFHECMKLITASLKEAARR